MQGLEVEPQAQGGEIKGEMLASSTDGVGTATQSIKRMVVRPPLMRSDAIRPD